MFKIVIKDSDIGYENQEFEIEKRRTASRGIVINEDKIALLYQAKRNEYKLPGGGVENDEDPTETFLREILEETGCKVKIIKQLGTTEEFKFRQRFYQLSHVFISQLIEDTHSLHLTDEEIEEVSKPVWVSLDEAIDLISKSMEKFNLMSEEIRNRYYATRFMLKRDLEILTHYKNSI
ncbi:MAG: NUDIX domain-containing protein [Clostridia bacterium]|nr:NUDIX domain-containing protein [Clostridia bacterium]